MPARKIQYCHVTVPNRAGQGAMVLEQLKAARVNLLGYSGFPSRTGKSQLDLMATSLGPIRKVGRKNGWKMSEAKKGFLIRGKDTLGAVHKQIRRLADQKINVTAADAVAAGKGQYGMILWVKERDYQRAARALKAK
jgi:hypothetical protein